VTPVPLEKVVLDFLSSARKAILFWFSIDCIFENCRIFLSSNRAINFPCSVTRQSFPMKVVYITDVYCFTNNGVFIIIFGGLQFCDVLNQ